MYQIPSGGGSINTLKVVRILTETKTEMESLIGYEYKYAELLQDHELLNQMVTDLVESKSFLVSDISFDDLVDSYRIYGNLKSAKINNAFATFAKMINSNSHDLTAKRNLDLSIDLKMNEYQSLSLTKFSQLQPFELAHIIANRLYSAIEINSDIIENEIEVLARFDELNTVRIRVSLKLVLATLGMDGFTFSPICNEAYYQDLFNMALMSNANKHDRILTHREREFENLRLPGTPDPTGVMSLGCIDEEDTPPTFRKRSQSDPSPKLSSDLHLYLEKNLEKLTNNSGMKFRPQRSSRASLNMMFMLGFQLETPGVANGSINLQATLELQDKLEMTYKLVFTKSTKRAGQQSSF
eukprot:TRINITY_DN5971_c1_g1_i1.p1 TRINITY_DN5971_c1_g1~~TRINITY_DN5971_c1_g1_i1.p1  ORF type:complete len:354 (-),score=59.38 TRINITY_DN5971_c1_g1_i1:138-1199(-)